MDDWDVEYLDKMRFFDLVDKGGLPAGGTLETASGLRASDGPYETDMVRRIEEAWRTPFASLTCEQVRLLLGQKMGLEWLGRPILEFVRRFPDGTVSSYPGEMVVLSLGAASEFAEFVGDEFTSWVRSDFDCMDRLFGRSRTLRRQAQDVLEHARATLDSR